MFAGMSTHAWIPLPILTDSLPPVHLHCIACARQWAASLTGDPLQMRFVSS